MSGIKFILALALVGFGLPAVANSVGPIQRSNVEPANAVEAAVLEAAWAQIAAPDRFVAQSVRLGPGTESLDAYEQATAKILAVAGPNSAGIVRVELQIQARDGSVRRERATVRGRVFGTALMADRTLLHKVAIATDAVKLGDADLTRLQSPPLRSADQLTGLVPSRTLSTGRILVADLFEAEPLVRKGDPVELLYQAGGVRLTLQAVALHDAAAGETTSARVAASGARVSGTLTTDGRLKVRHRIR